VRAGRSVRAPLAVSVNTRFSPQRLARRPGGGVVGRWWRRGRQPSRCPMPLTVAEPCDRAGCATLISETGSGRLLSTLRRGMGGCRRTTDSATTASSSKAVPGPQRDEWCPLASTGRRPGRVWERAGIQRSLERHHSRCDDIDRLAAASGLSRWFWTLALKRSNYWTAGKLSDHACIVNHHRELANE
jgi:hypothetical protein